MKPRTVFTVLDEAASRWGDAPALHQPIPGAPPEKKYQTWSWVEYRRAAEEVACGLRSIGIGKGDVVGLGSETRAEFYIADIGVMSNGSLAAALYISYPPAEQIATLKATLAKAVFVENPKMLTALRTAAGDWRPIWILLTGESDGVLTLKALQEMGRAAMAQDAGLSGRIAAEVSPGDNAILYLTSGATGQPKMVLTTHGSLVANADMGPVVLPLGTQDCGLAFLPSAHIAQRVVMEMVPLTLGTSIWFSESLTQLPHEMRSVRPTFLLAPPRVWERIYASICTEIRKRGAVTRRMFWGSIGLGSRAARLRQEGKSVPQWMQRSLKFADKAVFSKIRERFGGRIKVAASGAAPLGKDLAEFYDAIGMPLIEGYGLTEGGVVSLNPVDRPKVGTIGKALPGVDLRIAEDGELLVKSPCLFYGYYGDPAATAEVVKDGWLHTGDVATVDADGYVTITGRKKEMIVASNGKKIYPSRVENLFKTEPLISQMILVGDRMPYVSALFTVNVAAAEGLKGMEGMSLRSLEEIANAKPVLDEVRKAVSRANKQLAPFEQIRKFRILERDFAIDQGELTPTMKVRRAKVIENFRSTIAEMYAGKEEF